LGPDFNWHLHVYLSANKLIDVEGFSVTTPDHQSLHSEISSRTFVLHFYLLATGVMRGLRCDPRSLRALAAVAIEMAEREERRAS
jgi:hypothetical protein